MAKIVQPCAAAVCEGLREEAAKLKRLRVDGAAAEAAYQPPGHRTAPPGYHEASEAELRQMHLKPSMLNAPKDADGDATEFQAAVFINNKTNERIVAFKGTASGQDWANNLQQGSGLHSFYYTQSQVIGANVAGSPMAGSTHCTGHSLGGGLASAASRASGLPAATFNAATLKEGTIPQPNFHGRIDAVSVRGDPLTRANEGMLGTTRGTFPYKLDPPDNLGAGIAKDIPWWNLKQRAQAMGQRQLALHGMATANSAIAKRAGQVAAALVANKC